MHALQKRGGYMLLNIIFLFINISVLIFGYLIIKNNIEKKVIKKDVLNDIKKEVNSIIIKLNEVTVNNISLLEDKINNLDKKIILADKKTVGLKDSMNQKDLFETIVDTKQIEKKSYSPQKVIKQSKKTAENYNVITDEKTKIREEIKDLSLLEKASILIKEGWDQKEIQKEIGLSSGELELISNMEEIRK